MAMIELIKKLGNIRILKLKSKDYGANQQQLSVWQLVHWEQSQKTLALYLKNLNIDRMTARQKATLFGSGHSQVRQDILGPCMGSPIYDSPPSLAKE